MSQFIWVGLISVAGSFLQASTGFGYALLVMALWPLFLPFRAAAAMEIVTALAMVAFIAWRYRRHINLRLLGWPMVTVLLFNVLGFFLMVSSAESLLRRVMGGFLLLLSAYFVFFSAKVKLKPTPLTGLAAGAVGGFCGGMLGIGGPPMVAYFISVTQDKLEYVATLQFFFTLSGLQMLAVHAFSGSFTPEVLWLCGAAVAGMVLGTFLGSLLFRRLNMQGLKKIVYPLLALVGVYLLVTG